MSPPRIDAESALATHSRQKVAIEDFEDERDKLIKLKGTSVAYWVTGFGVFISMLTLVMGQPALVMFSALIFFCLFSEIVADVSRLIFYRRGV